MFLLIDSRDSFIYNLYSYFKISTQDIEAIDSKIQTEKYFQKE